MDGQKAGPWEGPSLEAAGDIVYLSPSVVNACFSGGYSQEFVQRWLVWPIAGDQYSTSAAPHEALDKPSPVEHSNA